MGLEATVDVVRTAGVHPLFCYVTEVLLAECCWLLWASISYRILMYLVGLNIVLEIVWTGHSKIAIKKCLKRY